MQCPACSFDNLPGAAECESCGTSLTQEDVALVQARNALARSVSEDHVAALEPATVTALSVEATLEAAVGAMRDRKLGALVLIDAEGRVAGILTERDLLLKVAGQDVDLAHSAVREFMTPDPETIRADHTLATALHRMVVGDHRHLLLTDEDGRPSGIISSRDVIGYLATRFREILRSSPPG